MEPDIPECNAPRLGAYEHIVRLVGPENAVADLVVADLEIAKPGNHPDRPVGIGAVGIRMGSDVFGRGIESLDGHVIVVVTLEGVFDQHIAAADEIHAVGVHDPADLLDIVDMHARAPDDLERPVRRVAQQDALDLQIVAIAELHLRPPAGAVILLRRTENTSSSNCKVGGIFSLDPSQHDRPFIEIENTAAFIRNTDHTRIVHPGTEISYIGTHRDRRVGQVGQDEEVLHPIAVELHRNLLRGIAQFELDAVRGLHVGHDAVRERTNLHFRKRPRTAGHADLQRLPKRVRKQGEPHCILGISRLGIAGIIGNPGIVNENLLPGSAPKNLDLIGGVSGQDVPALPIGRSGHQANSKYPEYALCNLQQHSYSVLNPYFCSRAFASASVNSLPVNTFSRGQLIR